MIKEWWGKPHPTTYAGMTFHRRGKGKREK